MQLFTHPTRREFNFHFEVTWPSVVSFEQHVFNTQSANIELSLCREELQVLVYTAEFLQRYRMILAAIARNQQRINDYSVKR